MLKVLFVTSEASPFVQTGGLGEVCGSLPKYLARSGCEVRLVLPAYGALKSVIGSLDPPALMVVPGYEEACSVFRMRLEPGLEILLVNCPPLFDRPGGPYADAQGRDWSDNPYRFAFFCHAIAAIAGDPQWRPDIVHANDWPTGLVPALLQRAPSPPKTLLTIHNLAFRGLCSREDFTHLRLPAEWWSPTALEFYGQCSLLKAGLVFADHLTTVSPTYAHEILTPALGHGLDGILRQRAGHLTGILNGIDVDVWDPADDPHLPACFTAKRLAARRKNKRALQESFGLPPAEDALLMGVVSRLTDQKGIDLIVEALRDPGPLRQCVILGSGEPQLEAALEGLRAAHPQHIACHFGYDIALSHQVFAGIDALLMPSRFEPCGLAQLYSQRYGAVPVVRRTGGLNDSVQDEATRHGTGFLFEEASAVSLADTLRRVQAVFEQPTRWRKLQRNGMGADFSWARSAQEYLRLYQTMLHGVCPSDAPA